MEPRSQVEIMSLILACASYVIVILLWISNIPLSNSPTPTPQLTRTLHSQPHPILTLSYKMPLMVPWITRLISRIANPKHNSAKSSIQTLHLELLPLPLTNIFRRCDILNRGYSGYTSRMILDILPKIVTREEARNIVAVTILLGTNDAVSKKKRPYHVPVSEYQENMKKIIQYLQVCYI